MDSINKSIARKYCIPTEKILYLQSNTIKEYLQLMGFDYERTMYHTSKKKLFKEGALADYMNFTIFNGSPDVIENFTHEVCHLYTHKLFGGDIFGRTYHDLIGEGVSTFLGGTVGKQLPYLLGSLDNDVVQGKYEYNFNDLIDDTVGVGEEDAHLSYVIGGLICQLAYEKEGMDGIFKLLQGGSTDEDLYKTVETVIGVRRENLDVFIRDELKKYAR